MSYLDLLLQSGHCLLEALSKNQSNCLYYLSSAPPPNYYATNMPIEVIEVHKGMGNLEKSFPRKTKFIFQCGQDSSGVYPVISMMDIVDPQGSHDSVNAGGQSRIYTFNGPEDQAYQISHLPGSSQTIVIIKVAN